MNNVIENTPFSRISMFTFKGVTTKFCYQYDILYILKGAIRIQSSKENFFLDEQDVILLNPNESYTIYGSNDNLVLSIAIRNDIFDKGQSVHTGRFIINSSLDKQRNYAELRKQMTRIGSVYFNKQDINHLHLAALGYQLLYYLNANHYEENSLYAPSLENSKYSERMNDILSYLHLHYIESISLQELAEHTHLSSSYLSKFFKKTVGMNFNQYLNQIRLHHATDDLLHTDHSIMSIAQENGFPNINSFNKLFKEQFQTTPNKYRSQMLSGRETAQSDTALVEEMPADANLHILEQYVDDRTPEISDILLPGQKELYLNALKENVTIEPLWNSMVNIGAAEQVREYNMEKILNNALQAVPFKYGRIYHCKSESFIPRNPDGTYEYYNFTSAIEMLLSANVLPYLELSDSLDFILYPDSNMKNNFSVDIEDYLNWISAFIEFCVSLFGKNIMQNWMFEITWYCYYPNHLWESPSSYAKRFAGTYEIIKRYIPEAQVGGFAFPSPLPEEHITEILDAMNEQNVVPDFFSYSIHPYEYTHSWNSEKVNINGEPKFFYTSDEHYALHKIQRFKKLLAQYPNYHNKPVHVTAISSGNQQSVALNDSCYQASMLAQSTMDLIQEVSILGYFQLSDLTFRRKETLHMCDGKNGLLNGFGIYKPGLYALSLLKNSGTQLIEHGENYILTRGFHQSYTLAVCNHIHVNEDFCMNPFQKISFNDTYAVFNPPKSLSISFSLDHVTEGTYTIVSYHLNRDHGSILDAWQEIGYWEHPDRNELDYLKHVTRYKRNLLTKNTKDGALSFQIQLAPHEVAVYIITLNL